MNMFKRVLTIVLAIAILSSNIVFAAESAMGSATQDSGSPSNEQGTDLPTVDPSVVGDPPPAVDPSVVGDPPPAVDPSVVGDPPPAVDPSVVGDPTPTVDPSVVGDPTPTVDPSVVGDPTPAVDPSVVGDPTTPPAVDQEGTLLRYTEQVTMHTVTFSANVGGTIGGEKTATRLVQDGEALGEGNLPEPTPDEGAYFETWKRGGILLPPVEVSYIENEKVTKDITYIAFFKKYLKLRYDTNGGEGTVTDDHEYMPNDVASISEAVPTRAKAIFLGWSTKKHELITTGTEADEVKSTLVIDTVTLATDVTLFAVWVEDTNGDVFPDYNQSRPSPTTTPDEPSSPDPTDTPTTVAPVVAPVAPVISVAVAPVTPDVTPDVTPAVTPDITPDVTPTTINTEDSVNISAVPDEEIALANAALGGQGPYGILSLVVMALTLATALAMHRGKQKKHE